MQFPTCREIKISIIRAESNSPLERGVRLMTDGVCRMTKKTIYPYNPNLKERARYLRNNSTLSEILLWNHLKGKQMRGYDFDRQKPIDNYIIDFFCNELKLAVEIDGQSHLDKIKEDKIRQQKIERFGIKFIRFSDLQVKQEMQNVLLSIGGWIEENKTHPCPSQEGNYFNRY